MRYALIGKSVSKSLSPLIHLLVGKEYSLLDVPGEDGLGTALSSDLDGFNVTMPYKKSIIPYLNEVFGFAKNCGVVNVVAKRDKKLVGYNTDFYGLEYMIGREGVSLKDKDVLILGGGATKDTAACLCRKKGARSVNFVSRSGEINYRNCYDLKGVRIIINATPVGSAGCADKKLISLDRFAGLEAYFDCVYDPCFTPMLIEAGRLGIKRCGGLAMLVEQALSSIDVWERSEHMQSLTDEIFGKVWDKTVNIVLVGMPSCGKTTVGTEIAKRTEKEFVDVDDLVEKEEGLAAGEIIKIKGEDYFRAAEKKAIKNLENTRGVVIATGGGAVKDGENVASLKANGVIFYIKRDLKLLSATGRPITEKVGAEELFAERERYYKEAASFEVDNDSSPEECAKKVVKLYEDRRY